jgi:hypothetical protein
MTKLYSFTITDEFNRPFNEIWELGIKAAKEQKQFEQAMDIWPWPPGKLILVKYKEVDNKHIYSFEVVKRRIINE